MTAQAHTAESGCANPDCACVPYDKGALSTERMPWKLAVADDGWPMVHNTGDVICVPDPNHHAGCVWDAARFRLIAAAPDLLEALTLMYRAYLGPHIKDDAEWIRTAEAAEAKTIAAIAKAAGEGA